VFSYLQNKEALKELFSSVAEAVGERPGGYTRVIRTGFRTSDASEMALIELVDFNTIYSTAKGESKSKKRRTRRGGKGSSETATAVATAATAAVVAEDTKSEEEE
jgi:large subunit ribosomal protein L17